MKRSLAPVLVFVSVFASSCLFNLKKEPKVSVESFEIAEIGLKDIVFDFVVVIENPLPVGIKLAGIDIGVFIENKRLLKTRTSEGFTIGAKAKRKNQFIARVEFAKIYQIIQDYRKKEYLDGDFNIDISILLSKDSKKPLVIPVRLHKKIPVIRPRLRIANFKIHPPAMKEFLQAVKKNLKNQPDPIKLAKEYETVFEKGKWSKSQIISKLGLKLNVSFDLLVINETSHKMSIEKLDFNLRVANDPFLSGTSQTPYEKDEAIVLPMESVLEISNLTGAQLKELESGNIDYELETDGVLKLPSSVSAKPVKLKFKDNGSFKY